MASMKMMLVLLGLVAAACAAPQFSPSHFVPVGYSNTDSQGSNETSAEEDSTVRALDTATSAYGSAAVDSSSTRGGSSLHGLIYGEPSIINGAQSASSSTSSFGGSPSFGGAAQNPSDTDYSSGSSGSGVGGASGSSSFGGSPSFIGAAQNPSDTDYSSGSSGSGVGGFSGASSFGGASDQSGSASDVYYSRSNPSPIAGDDSAKPASVSSSDVSSSVSSGSSSGFGGYSSFSPSVYQSSDDSEITTESETTTEVSSSTDFTFNYSSGSSGSGATNPQRAGFF